MLRQTVLLHHELPDGSSHFDWMLALDEPASRPLLTWRCERRADEAAPGEILVVERIGDHRVDYLRYEGAIAGERGWVRRVASGWWDGPPDDVAAPKIDLHITWEGRPVAQHWELSRTAARRLT